MTQSPQRGQTAPPNAASDTAPDSSEFGSVTTQRSAASSSAASSDATTTDDHATDSRDTASWDSSPFSGGSGPGSSGPGSSGPGSPATESSATTNPSLPTAPGAPSRPSGIGSASYADASAASTGSMRTEQAGPALGAVGTTPPANRAGASSNNRAAKANRARGPRRARLQLRHINPWTVLKFSCVLSIALFFVWLIVVGVLFGILDGAGIISKINDTITTINGAGSTAPIRASIVFGGAAIIGVVNIVLFIALSTVGSVVYNLCADLVGGIEITLSER